MELVCDKLIPSLLEEGVFGDVKFLRLEPDIDTEKGAQFASDLAFVNLITASPSGQRVFPLVVKLPFADLQTRIIRNCNALFHNEVTMYSEIIPCLGVSEEMHPKMHYGIATDGVEPDKDLIIIENLKHRGFLLAKEKIFLDYDYISVILKGIAKFHSYSYILKHKDPEKFFELVKKLWKVEPPKEALEEFELCNVVWIERGIKPLIKKNVSVDLLENLLSVLKFPDNVRNAIIFPEDPFAVICHGDLCGNNILYKHDKSGKPVGCSFFDFQLSRYGNLVIDLVFLLYLNTTQEFRMKHWDDCLEIYWKTLRASIPDDIVIPTFEEFLKHFSERAVFGYTICSFFLPAMLENENNPIKIEELNKLKPDDKINFLLNFGQEETQNLITDIVSHLLEKKYIHAFLEFYNNKHKV